MKRKNTAIVIAIILAVLLSVTACAGQSGNDPASSTSTGSTSVGSTSTEASGSDGINIFVGTTLFDGSLDPVKGAMSYGYSFTNIALLKVSPDSEYVGDAASDWEISDDAKTYTFHIRNDIKFSDGSDLTAEDVVFTYETVKANQAENGDVDLSKLASVKAEGDSTVVFSLTEPYSPFLDTSAMLGIVPSDAYDSAAFDQAPIGAGPWKVIQYDANQQIIVAPNEYYYEGAPSIGKITLVYMDNDAAIAAAKSGQLDVVMVDPNYAKEVIDGMVFEEFATMDIRMISLPVMSEQKMKDPDGNEIAVGNKVTSDVSVRKALSIGIDRTKIIENAFNGIGKPAISFTDNLIWAEAGTYKDNQKEEAKKILEDAGWIDEDGDGVREKDGVDCAFEVLATETARYQLAAATAEDAAELGIKIEAKNGTWDDVDKYRSTGGVVWGWGQYSPTVLRSLFSSEAFMTSAFDNVVGYSNPKVDSRIKAALSESTQEKAMTDWKEVQKLANADYPYLYLVNIEHCYFVSDTLDVSKDTQIPHPHGHGAPIICNMKDWTLN